MKSQEMDLAFVQQAAERLSSVLFLDVPQGTLSGVDLNIYTVGEKFKGLKMIPHGVHFFSTCCRSQENEVAPPVSWFVFFDHSEVLVRKWNSYAEQLDRLKDLEQEERYKLGVRRYDFDSYLAPYDLSSWQEWRKLSTWITKDTINTIMGYNEFISIPEASAEHTIESPSGEYGVFHRLHERKTAPGTSFIFHYTSFPRLVKKEVMTVSDLTSANMDRTEELKKILNDAYENHLLMVLGELQFAFISFIFGQSLRSLEQWKLIVHFLLKCYDGLSDTCLEELFVNFLKVLKHQLQFLTIHEETDSADMLSDSFLKVDLIQFLQFSLGEAHSATITHQCSKIATFVQESLGWEVQETEDDEYAPAIVET